MNRSLRCYVAKGVAVFVGMNFRGRDAAVEKLVEYRGLSGSDLRFGGSGNEGKGQSSPRSISMIATDSRNARHNSRWPSVACASFAALTSESDMELSKKDDELYERDEGTAYGALRFTSLDVGKDDTRDVGDAAADKRSAARPNLIKMLN